jgi:hypothetical protein
MKRNCPITKLFLAPIVVVAWTLGAAMVLAAKRRGK